MYIIALLPPPFNIASVRISTSSCPFSNSIVLTSGLYFREQRSTLYTVITAGVAVKVSSSTAGTTVIVKLKSATGRVANY